MKIGFFVHGRVSSEIDEPALGGIERAIQRLKRIFHARKGLFLVVIFPTLLTAAYYYLVAANQFESEAHFLVQRAQAGAEINTGFSKILGLSGAASGQSEALSVSDYLTSHDAVAALNKRINLAQTFRRPEADFFSKLNSENPAPESLLKYYRKQIKVSHSSDTGIITLEVKTFRPEDSYKIASILLDLGEKRVNTLNKRSFEDAVSISQQQLEAAERGVTRAQLDLTHFRQTHRDIDPPSSGEVQTKLVSGLEAALAEAKAELATTGGLISARSPQYKALASRVSGLQAQVNAQAGRLTGSTSAIAADLGTYEELKLRQDFSAKRYEVAAASLEKARSEATKQQLFVARVVEPNMPVKALFPERLKIVATVFGILMVCYGIGWLIVAGVKEHAS